MAKNIIRMHDFGRSESNGPWGKNNVARVLNRLYYVYSGSSVVNYAKKDHVLTAGNVYLLPQCKNFHRVDAKDFDHIFFDFYSSLPLRQDSFTEIPAEKFNLKTIFEFFGAKKLNRVSQKDREYALNMLTTILSYLDLNMKLPYVSDKNIIRAMELFETMPDISTKEIANILHLNESYFIRLFTKVMGIPPMKFNRLSRLNYGLSLLESGYSVAYVAEACGYSSNAAFGKAFKKTYGCAPLVYKHKNGL